jgi:hypothetical protein
MERVLTLLLKKLNRLSHSGRVRINVDDAKGHYDRVVDFFRSVGNAPQTAGAIIRATRIPRGSLSQILYRNHKDSFVSVLAPGYSRKRLWQLTQEALKAAPVAGRSVAGNEAEEQTERTLFGIQGDLTGVDAADCCYRILKDSGNRPLNVLTMTREALRRGYRARTRGTEDEVLFSTAKSFWARLGRDERFRKVRPFVYVLAE